MFKHRSMCISRWFNWWMASKTSSTFEKDDGP